MLSSRLRPLWVSVALVVFAGVISGCNTDARTGSGGDTTADWQALSMSLPSWASTTPQAGEMASNQQLQVQVHMRMHNEAAARTELADISNPHSTNYGHFLTAQQFASKYGPTQEEVAAVQAHLEQNGMTVIHVPTNNAYITAVGQAAQVSQAFGTKLGLYNVNGQTRFAPANTPRMPRTLAPTVLNVLGLSTPVQMGSHAVRVGGIKASSIPQLHPHDGAGGGVCSEWYGQAADTTDPAYTTGYPALTFLPCPYRPAQIRNAYGFNRIIRTGNDGTGINIAIIDAYQSPTLLQDAQTYAANNDPDYPLLATQFSAQMAPGTPTPVDPNWFGEQTLDVEAVHAMAPGANIVYVGAQSASDIDLVAAINVVVSGGLADIVSNSYGSAEANPNDFVVFHHIALQAGLKGIGLYFSSGDNGDESFNIGFPSADFPASSDNVTAVGGTSLALAQDGTVLFQTGWETGASFLTQVTTVPDGGDPDAGVTSLVWQPDAPGVFVFGAGGGASAVYEQPDWQVGVVPDAMANVQGAPSRVVPDVSMVADPITGFLVGESDPTTGIYSEGAVGGTSLACPLFAASMALAEQNAGRSFGFANPLLYSAAGTAAFTDVVPQASPNDSALPGIALTFDYPGLAISTAVGYDNVTGLGTPNGQSFLDAIQ